MTGYIIRRFLWMVPVMLMVTIVTFGAMKLVPGGPFATSGRPMPPEIQAELMTEFGSEAQGLVSAEREPFGINTFINIVPRNVVGAAANGAISSSISSISSPSGAAGSTGTVVVTASVESSAEVVPSTYVVPHAPSVSTAAAAAAAAPRAVTW